jgi:hypothetical protein
MYVYVRIMHKYVCMHISMYVCMYAYKYVSIHVCKHICMYVYVRMYCHIYHGCVVVWPITRRRFGLVTGFIHYGDYNCNTSYNYIEHYTTGSFSDPTDGTVLRWRLADEN